ncbi:UBP1-associated proteins 1C [Juglans microcarpa x Juglans regia]|uniref:UBP1-associated proteins 1C n=1 Tax=Juglans microcarpa x Juglans regia TaxID=2249226 RepID=UPI001B7DE7F5|nr:UBP1-associated proteins 1C [Juglans microcarpa x Juglans regia]
MVWFQCEDCGENLKKPKLPNHFRICSASKLSCIDCGQTFGQQSVQGHTQCITEAEKYGPKGQGNASNALTAKPNKNSKQQPDIDINVGLSERPPWFCSLCNTSATSKQALLLHAEGKKHRAKARAFHAAKDPPKQTEESTPDAKLQTGDTQKDELVANGHVKEPKLPDPPKADIVHNNLESDKGAAPSKKKRELEGSAKDGSRKKAKGDTSSDLGNGEVIHGEKEEAAETKSPLKDDKLAEYSSAKEDTKEKIKWRKLITSALKSNPDGFLKMRKLRKLVLKALRESGITEDESKLIDMLEHKINSSSRFTMEKKYVHLMARD